MDWKTRIEALKTRLNLKDDGVAELLGITPRTLLDLRKGLKDPTGPVQRLIEMYLAKEESRPHTSARLEPLVETPIVLEEPTELHLVLMHGDFDLGDGRNKYDAIVAMHGAVGRSVDYHYITTPPFQHAALIKDGLRVRGITMHFLKGESVVELDCQFTAIAMWLAGQANQRSRRAELKSVTIAAPPARFRVLAQTLRQYAKVDVTLIHGRLSVEDAEACRLMATEGVLTADVDGRRFGRVKKEAIAESGERPLSIEILGTPSGGDATLSLEPARIRRNATGGREIDPGRLNEGDLVSYSIGMAPDGNCAMDIALVKSAAEDSILDGIRVMGGSWFADDNSPDVRGQVREAIAVCATADGWASFENVWNRLCVLARESGGWYPGEKGAKLLALSRKHREYFELDADTDIPSRIRARGFEV